MSQFFTLIGAIFKKEPGRWRNLLLLLLLLQQLYRHIVWFEMRTIKWRKSRFYHRMNIIYLNFTHYLRKIDATNQWIIVTVLCKWELNWNSLWIWMLGESLRQIWKCTIDMLDYCAVVHVWFVIALGGPHPTSASIERYLIRIDKLYCGKCMTW